MGDGTTTSTLLAYTLIKEIFKNLDKTTNVVSLKKEMEIAVDKVLKYIEENIKEEISNEAQLKQIASISANNDKEIGEIIISAIDQVGIEGIVHLESSRTGQTYLENVEGMQFDRGYQSPYFVTNNSTMTSNLNDVSILIYDGTLSGSKTLLPLLEHAATSNKSLLIIADDFGQDVLSMLIVNKMKGTLRVCAVKAPDFGDRRKLILDDIAVLTGGEVVSPSKGMKLDKFDLNWL